MIFSILNLLSLFLKTQLHQNQVLYFHKILVCKMKNLYPLWHWKHFLHWTHLLWNLAKVVDEAIGGIIFERIINPLDVNIAPVKQMMEHIDCLDSCWSLLFVSKHQICPLMDVGANIVTLQGLDQRTQTCSVNLYRVLIGLYSKNCTHIILEYTVFYCNRQRINLHSLL